MRSTRLSNPGRSQWQGDTALGRRDQLSPPSRLRYSAIGALPANRTFGRVGWIAIVQIIVFGSGKSSFVHVSPPSRLRYGPSLVPA